MPDRPSVTFICVKNGGKSQMAAGLMSKLAGDRIDVYSAGTQPGNGVNALSPEVLAEVGVDISQETTKPIDPTLLGSMTTVATLGREAHVDPVERMRLVRDDIAARVAILRDKLIAPHTGWAPSLR